MKKTLPILTMVTALAVGGGFYGWFYRSSSETSVPAEASQDSKKFSRITDSEIALAERVKAAREISTDLTSEEMKELIAFLSKPIDDHNREREFLAINQVMDQLRASGMANGEYATALCGLIRNPSTHPVVRDYSIQHAIQWIREAKNGRAPAQVSEEDRKHMLDCIVSFMQEPTSLNETGYGTALNIIRSLENSYPEETAEIYTLCAPRIVEVAAGKESAPLANRISAIQALTAIPKSTETLSLVRGMVVDAPTGSPVRLVAIAALGTLGDKSDLATLRKLEKDDSRVSYAARSAASHLESTLLPGNR